MDDNTLIGNKTKKISVSMIEPMLASEIWRSIATPSAWLENLDNKIRGEHDRQCVVFFAASMDKEYVGLIAIELATSNNAHIKWMMVNQPNDFHSIGKKLLLAAEEYCLECGCSSLTVEIISPKDNDTNNLTLYDFYKNSGYKPLFESYSQDTKHLMVYMQQILSLNDFIFIDLTHSLSADVPHWGVDVGFKYNARYIQSPESHSNVKFRVQRLEMSSGIGTHMDAPSHCFEHAPAINDIPLQSLITLCRVIDVSNKVHDRYSVTVDDIRLFEEKYGVIPKNTLVMIYTGWDQRWEQPEKYRNEKIFPNISIDAAKLLLSRNIVGIGIDTLSPDAFGSDFPVHQLILGAGKYIIENVANLKQLDPIGCFIFALPIKIVDGTEAPMRLVGMKRKR